MGPPNLDDDLRARRRRRASYYFPPAQIIAIFALTIGLVAVVTLKDGCAKGAGNLLKAFEGPPDAGPQAPKTAPGAAPGPSPGGQSPMPRY